MKIKFRNHVVKKVYESFISEERVENEDSITAKYELI